MYSKVNYVLIRVLCQYVASKLGMHSILAVILVSADVLQFSTWALVQSVLSQYTHGKGLDVMLMGKGRKVWW